MNAMDNLVTKISELIGSDEFIPLHEPKFNGNASKYVLDCVETGWVSTAGRYVNELEDRICKNRVKICYCSLVRNCSPSFECLASGVRPNDEVICPDITFVAS